MAFYNYGVASERVRDIGNESDAAIFLKQEKEKEETRARLEEENRLELFKQSEQEVSETYRELFKTQSRIFSTHTLSDYGLEIDLSIPRKAWDESSDAKTRTAIAKFLDTCPAWKQYGSTDNPNHAENHNLLGEFIKRNGLDSESPVSWQYAFDSLDFYHLFKPAPKAETDTINDTQDVQNVQDTQSESKKTKLTKAELNRMSSAEFRKRLFNDPDFAEQVVELS